MWGIVEEVEEEGGVWNWSIKQEECLSPLL